MKECTIENYQQNCPIFDIHDKIEEAFYFLITMIENYHIPSFFRYNLNAFIQSLRSITFFIQSNKSKIYSFDSRYSEKQREMKNISLLSKISNARNYIVHERMLKSKSSVYFGLFRGRLKKINFNFEIDPFAASHTLLINLIATIKGTILDFVGDHSAINEQYGLMRTWIIDEISSNEIASECYKAYMYFVEMVGELHNMFGYIYTASTLSDDFISNNQVLLETDIDPSLIDKWGWN